MSIRTPNLTRSMAPELEQKIDMTVPGMAHLANTGPFSRTCGDCAFLGYIRNKRLDGKIVTYWSGGCRKFYALTQQHGPSVPPDTPSCRYFEAASRKTLEGA